MASYEMAYRLQTSAPELTDLRSETKATLDMYGCDPAKPSFARCVPAGPADGRARRAVREHLS